MNGDTEEGMDAGVDVEESVDFDVEEDEADEEAGKMGTHSLSMTLVKEKTGG